MRLLYLYALINDCGQYTYIGATSRPEKRERVWGKKYPTEEFEVLAVGSEAYILEMELKLIRHCFNAGIPIRNKRVGNLPVEVCRKAGQAGARTTNALPMMRDVRSKAGRLGGPKGIRRARELHPEALREGSRKSIKAMHERHPDLTRETLRRTRERYPDMVREAGRKGGQISNHNRWHVRRGIMNPSCRHCQERLLEGQWLDRTELQRRLTHIP